MQRSIRRCGTLAWLTTIVLVNVDVVEAARSRSSVSADAQIAVEAKESVPAWSKPVSAPVGAPNILLIMLDDVGFADTTTFGGIAQTPTLDQLAAQGVRYNRFHTTAICSPTRAALLSGRNHHRVGFGGFGGVGFPGYDGVWKKNVASLPEVLKRNGYSTAAFGKWHNTPLWEITPIGPFDRWPTNLGFEYYYGSLLGATSQWEPSLWRNTTVVAPPKTPEQGYHYTADLVDDAIRWIHTHRSLASKKPFFIYIATGAAHMPHHVPREWIEKYRGKFDEGWDRLRLQIFRQQKQLGIVPLRAELTPRPQQIRAWTSLSSDERALLAHQMEVYAGFISHTDYHLGRLVRTAREGPYGENTIILYIVGDNGPDPSGGTLGTDNLYDPLSRSDSAAKRLLAKGLLGGVSTYGQYAAGWSWMGSTPFKWMKFSASHLGGTRNPLVVSWPARLRHGGDIREQFTHVVDVAPTIYEITGIQFPSVLDGVPQVPLSGVSFAQTLDDPNAASRHRVQYFEIAGNRALYKDGWMASAMHMEPLSAQGIGVQQREGFDLDRWELYNLDEDFSQADDLSSKYPERLRELQKEFETQASQNQVYPMGAQLLELRAPEWLARNADSQVFYAGFPGVPIVSKSTLDFQRSHRAVAHVTIPEGGAEGVLIANGGRAGGFSLYLQGNRLIYESNCSNRERIAVVASAKIPSGNIALGYDFIKLADSASLRLSINDTTVADGIVTCTATPELWDNFDVGRDSGTPVSTAYKSPFDFSGTLHTLKTEYLRQKP